MENMEDPMAALSGLAGSLGAVMHEAMQQPRCQYAIAPWEAVNAMAADGWLLIETIQPIVIGPARWASMGYPDIEGQAPGWIMKKIMGPADDAAALLAAAQASGDLPSIEAHLTETAEPDASDRG